MKSLREGYDLEDLNQKEANLTKVESFSSLKQSVPEVKYIVNP